MVVLSVDPGYSRLGLAVLEDRGGNSGLVYSVCLETSKNLDFEKRLFLISKEINRLIDEFKPGVLAIENLFFNKNQKTAMRVAEVRGAIINTCLSKNIKIEEFTPLEVKVAITGYGRSKKEQLIEMLKKLIKIPERVLIDDEFDAIAVGLTYLATRASRQNGL